MAAMRVVHAEKGAVWGISLFSIAVSCYVLGSFVVADLHKLLSLSGDLNVVLNLAAFVVMAYLGLEIGTQRVRITRDSLKVVNLFGSTEVQWVTVEEIYVPPAFGYTFGVGYNLTVVAKNPKRPGRLRRVGLPASLYANRHWLVKAVLEAAHINNPFVAINGTVKQTYGPPPYGIFTDR